MMTIITHAIAFFLGCGGGYWLHYKFGATLAKDAALVKTAVQDFKK